MLNTPMNIIFSALTSKYDEVTDSIYDALRAGHIIEEALADGWQLTDLFSVVKSEKYVSEIVNDFPEFLDQFTNLAPEMALPAIRDAREKLETEVKLGKVSSFILASLEELAKSYEFAHKTKVDAEAQVNRWKTLFGTFSETA